MEPKKISVSVCIPVVVELDVVWDEQDESAEIKGVEIRMIQEKYTPRSLCEHLSEDDFEHIDEETKRVFGIEG